MAVEGWIADLQASGLGPSGVRQARQVLNAMLFLDADEVERLADTIQQPHGTLAYGGLPWGEAAALRRKRGLELGGR
jgi:hypothetical protein